MSAEPAHTMDEGGDVEPEVSERPLPVVDWLIQTTRLELSVDGLHRRFLQGELIIDPGFARDVVWDTATRSRLIESVLLRIPLPTIYLFEDLDGKMTVIDGQQRLDALFSFIGGRFALQHLPLLQDLDGKNFESLERRLQRRLLDTPLTCVVVLPGTSADIKFEIFLRLNVGASPWNGQEIRNSLFRGAGLNLVKQLANDTGHCSFRGVAGRHRMFARMSADELVLRGLAFLDRGPERYTGDMAAFLSDELARLNRTAPENLARLERRFRLALERIATTFGEKAFCRYIPSEERWSSKLNGPLVEILVTGFDRVFPEGTPLAPSTAIEISERFKRLCADPAFVSAITGATHSVTKVSQRFSMWMKELADAA